MRQEAKTIFKDDAGILSSIEACHTFLCDKKQPNSLGVSSNPSNHFTFFGRYLAESVGSAQSCIASKKRQLKFVFANSKHAFSWRSADPGKVIISLNGFH
jgi:hypothetical protein